MIVGVNGPSDLGLDISRIMHLSVFAETAC